MTTTDATSLTAGTLLHALETAERWLDHNREAINSINVYPVPDGDTGTNMLLTLRAALDAGARAQATSAGVYAHACARGALLGARGNSGVILSQMIRGFAAALEGAEVVDAAGLRSALDRASRTAYEAVSAPVEGTMLTVLKDAARAGSAGSNVVDVLRAAEAEAYASVDRTPDLLPRLREAGVVDSGGLGVAVILAGLRMGVTGEPLPEAAEPPRGAVELAAVAHDGHGYCTEYLVERRDGAPLDRVALLGALEAVGGDSILVVGDPDALHVHVHLEDPGPALSVGVAFGEVHEVKVDNMQLQHEAWSAAHRDGAIPAVATPVAAISVVAVANGPGIAAAFRDVGAVPLLTSARPSPADFLDLARSSGSRHVFLLPNDRDAIMAAEQAALEAPGLVTVIPTRSIPAGIAAAVAATPDDDPRAVEDAMRFAADGVRCVEVTFAARNATVAGVTAHAAAPIAFLDGAPAAVASTLEDALLAALQLAITPASQAISLYLGADAPRAVIEALVARLEGAFPGVTVELIEGGQPYYPFVAGVE